MRSFLFYANIIAILILSVFAVVSTTLTVYNYAKYGLSYEVTTIVAGEIQTRTTTIWDNFNVTVLLGLILVLLIFDTITLESHRNQPPILV